MIFIRNLILSKNNFANFSKIYFNQKINCSNIAKILEIDKNFGISKYDEQTDLESKKKQDYFDQLKPVIGLEVHAQLLINTKLFSTSIYDYKSIPNTNVSFFDCSLPGTLPILNKNAIKKVIQTGLAFGCIINDFCTFDRKHYFYPDMPNGYQITQNKNPIAKNGSIEFIVYDSINKSYLKKVNLKQIQLEQDSGKSILVDNEILIDLNRVGVGLMEFVFEPEIESSQEAYCLIKELHLTLQRLNVCSGKMEQGEFRVDSNVSVHIPGEELGTRVEIKNLNSFNSIRLALDYEIQRQKEAIYNNEKVLNETRYYDAKAKKTYVLRDKEIIQDYRIMPEPNLIPFCPFKDLNSDKNNLSNFIFDDLAIDENQIPSRNREILLNKFNLSLDNAYILINNKNFFDVFINVMEAIEIKHAFHVADFICTTLNLFLKQEKITIDKMSFSITFLIECIKLIIFDKITNITAFELLVLKQHGKLKYDSVLKCVEEMNWFKIDDLNQIKQIINSFLDQQFKNYTGKIKNKNRTIKDLLKKFYQVHKGTIPIPLCKKLINECIEERFN